MSIGDTRLEIGHVLFIDIVGYSKLLVKQQSELLRELNEVVSGTNEFRQAESAGKLIRLPTGDGMALVFRTNTEAPAECAIEIARALKSHPAIQLRMGIHSGPVNEVVDVNQRANIAGAGINIAQRVMDCGDAGHILLSKHVAEDLEQDDRRRPLLHDLGECEVKHGARVNVTNLYSDEVGNPQLPKKFQMLQKHHAYVRWPAVAIGLLVVAALAAGVLSFLRKGPARSLATAVEKSIAVLPFENLSSDKENAYFTDGVQDEILTDLAKIADLKVISRTSVMQYKTATLRNLREIGQQLGVANLLEGSVQRSGDRVRVIAQLIDARNDMHLWAQTYDRNLVDVFAIQSEIAKSIADHLQAKLSPAEKNAIEEPPTKDIAAFELYSRARDLILNFGFSNVRAQDMRSGIDLLNQALARDPSFFAAQCQLAFTHDTLYSLGLDHTPERLALAEAAIGAAFRLRPHAGEAHLARARHLYASRDYDGALAELEIARRTLPNDPGTFELTGYVARRRGQYEEGLDDLQRAMELDPRNFFMLQQVASTYKLLRRYSEEIVTEDRALSIKPEDAETKATRAVALFDWKADTRSLHETIDEIRTQQPSDIQSVADAWFLCALAERDGATAEMALAALGEATFGDGLVQFNAAFGSGLIARMMKDETKARAVFAAIRAQQEKIVQAQPDFGPAVCILALIEAGIGRKQEALRGARRAIELVPVTKDSVTGAEIILYSAIVAAWVDEKELALERLAKAAQLPGFVTYGRLKSLPWWDPLRGDPRFEKIVVSLAPKENTENSKK